MSYEYPIDFSWTHDEMASVIHMWTIVERVYESSETAATILSAYREFKAVVRSKGEERQLSKQFEQVSGYSLYRVIQQAQNAADTAKISLRS